MHQTGIITKWTLNDKDTHFSHKARTSSQLLIFCTQRSALLIRSHLKSSLTVQLSDFTSTTTTLSMWENVPVTYRQETNNPAYKSKVSHLWPYDLYANNLPDFLPILVLSIPSQVSKVFARFRCPAMTKLSVTQRLDSSMSDGSKLFNQSISSSNIEDGLICNSFWSFWVRPSRRRHLRSKYCEHWANTLWEKEKKEKIMDL